MYGLTNVTLCIAQCCCIRMGFNGGNIPRHKYNEEEKHVGETQQDVAFTLRP